MALVHRVLVWVGLFFIALSVSCGTATHFLTSWITFKISVEYPFSHNTGTAYIGLWKTCKFADNQVLDMHYAFDGCTAQGTFYVRVRQ